MAEAEKTPGPVPEGMGTIMDSHIHTVRGASDSALRPDDLLEEALRIGLTGINISEHDRPWERSQWEQLTVDAGDIFLSRGMEVSTDMGHIIVYGIDEYYSGMRSCERLREICDEIGAFMSVAHPFRHYFDPVEARRQGRDSGEITPAEAAERMRVFDVVHGIEVGNGGNTRSENVFAHKVAQLLEKPVTGGSDAHSTSGIGLFTTVFPERVRNHQDVLDMLRERRTECWEQLNVGNFRRFVPAEDE